MNIFMNQMQTVNIMRLQPSKLLLVQILPFFYPFTAAQQGNTNQPFHLIKLNMNS